MKRTVALFTLLAASITALPASAQTIEELALRVKSLEQAIGMPERVTKQSSASVALIVGEYIWTDPTSGKPLRSDSGKGPIIVREFSGSGFLLESGKIMTSGFVLAPWQDDPLLDTSEEPRLVPVISLLRAYFPNEAEPVELKFGHAAETEDAVLLTYTGKLHSTPPLTLTQSNSIQTGEAVLALGYPGGVHLLTSRLPLDLKRELFKFRSLSIDALAGELARRGLIQPLALFGRISGQLDGEIYYDLLNSNGNTGGPLLNPAGQVIAISEATMPEYPSFNLAQSICNLRSWLDSVQAPEEY